MGGKIEASIACLVFTGVGTYIFSRHRHRFPIADRGLITLASSLTPWLIAASYLGDGNRSQEEPCSLLQSAVAVLVMPLSVFFFVIRAWWLLFKFEITKDLSGRAAANNSSFVDYDHLSSLAIPYDGADLITSGDGTGGGNPSGHTVDIKQSSADAASSGGGTANTYLMVNHGPNNDSSGHGGIISPLPPPASVPTIRPLSWYTRHYHYMSARYVALFASPMIILGVVIWCTVTFMRATTSCRDQDNRWTALQVGYSFISIVIQCICVLRISCKLARHGRDSLGIKFELIANAVVTMVLGIVGLPVGLILGGGPTILVSDEWAVCVLASTTFLWCWVTIYPLHLAYKHHRRQLAIANDVQRVQSLTELLMVPQAAKAFQSFLAKEFCLENLIFWQRIQRFKAMALATANNDDNNGTNHHHRHQHSDHIILLDASATVPASKSSPSPSAATSSTKITPVMLQRVLRDAHVIHQLFVVPGGHFEVNLSSHLRQQINRDLQQLTTAVQHAMANSNNINTNNSPNNNKIDVTAKQLATYKSHKNGNTTGNDDHTTATANANSNLSPNRILLNNITMIYDEALKEVVHLMETNHFRRFLASSLYTQLIDQLQTGVDGTQKNGSKAKGSKSKHGSQHDSPIQTHNGNGGANGARLHSVHSKAMEHTRLVGDLHATTGTGTGTGTVGGATNGTITPTLSPEVQSPPFLNHGFSTRHLGRTNSGHYHNGGNLHPHTSPGGGGDNGHTNGKNGAWQSPVSSMPPSACVSPQPNIRSPSVASTTVLARSPPPSSPHLLPSALVFTNLATSPSPGGSGSGGGSSTATTTTNSPQLAATRASHSPILAATSIGHHGHHTTANNGSPSSLDNLMPSLPSATSSFRATVLTQQATLAPGVVESSSELADHQ